jgi:hypothetical protein
VIAFVGNCLAEHLLLCQVERLDTAAADLEAEPQARYGELPAEEAVGAHFRPS